METKKRHVDRGKENRKKQHIKKQKPPHLHVYATSSGAVKTV